MCDILKVRKLSKEEIRTKSSQTLMADYAGVGWLRASVYLKESSMAMCLMRGAVLYACMERGPTDTPKRMM
jgi:hypothetical protein